MAVTGIMFCQYHKIQQFVRVHHSVYDVRWKFTFYYDCCCGRSKFDEHACCRIPWPIPADTNNLTRVFLSKLHEAHQALGKSRIIVEHGMFSGFDRCVAAILPFLSRSFNPQTLLSLLGCRRLQSHMA